MHIGNRIKKIRESVGISRKEFARGIVSYSHLCNIEDGNYNASEDIMIAIAEKLNVSADYLIKYNTIDYNLENLLMYFKSELDQLNIKDAETILKTIRNDYPYITSISQETFLFLLESYYYLSIGEIDVAKEIL
ncbi:MAG: helix-turn-helix domain-containing protein [Vulcanibacillus sp.]